MVLKIAEMQNPNMAMAAMLGALAAVIAGVGWFWFVIITNFEIGYVAIGVGFLIGYGVLLGAGKKRGQSLQVMAALFTFLTIYLSKYCIFLHVMKKYLLENRGYTPGALFFISPFDQTVLRSVASPIGILIWAIGIYFAYSIPKPRVI